MIIAEFFLLLNIFIFVIFEGLLESGVAHKRQNESQAYCKSCSIQVGTNLDSQNSSKVEHSHCQGNDLIVDGQFAMNSFLRIWMFLVEIYDEAGKCGNQTENIGERDALLD
jgi:hypothetical protein